MADVARLAQVSTATVSYLLSGRDELMRRVGPEAQERIRNAVRALGYVQNKTARHLRLQRTERICVLLPQLGNPFADKMANDIEAVARRRGFGTVIVPADRDIASLARVVREVESGLADALIADTDGLGVAELSKAVEPLERLGKAALMIYPATAGRAFSVVTHGRLEALEATLATHVRTRGHRRIAYVANRSQRPNPRVEAMLAFAAADPAFAAPVIMDGGEARARAAERAGEIAGLAPRPTLVIVESDFAAVAMIQEFRRLGVRVPDDIAVIGFGNAEEGYYCEPRLSTIGPISVSMTEATEHLLDVVTGRADPRPRQFMVPWRLYVRESG